MNVYDKIEWNEPEVLHGHHIIVKKFIEDVEAGYQEAKIPMTAANIASSMQAEIEYSQSYIDELVNIRNKYSEYAEDDFFEEFAEPAYTQLCQENTDKHWIKLKDVQWRFLELYTSEKVPRGQTQVSFPGNLADKLTGYFLENSSNITLSIQNGEKYLENPFYGLDLNKVLNEPEQLLPEFPNLTEKKDKNEGLEFSGVIQ